jgi:hypothetical protein
VLAGLGLSGVLLVAGCGTTTGTGTGTGPPGSAAPSTGATAPSSPGCRQLPAGGPCTIATTITRGGPPGAPNLPAGGKPYAVVVTDLRRLELTTWGSGSCPAVPVAWSPAGTGRLAVSVSTGGGGPCTADYGPTTSTVPLPASAGDLSLIRRVTVTDVTDPARPTVSEATVVTAIT